MANSARGEADLAVNGQTYRISMTMGALAEMAAALEVKTFQELQARITEFNLQDMPKIVAAVLKGNGYDVPMADINKMDWQTFFDSFIPAFFRSDKDAKPADGEAAANPLKRQKR